MDTLRTPPYHEAAEEAVIGIALRRPDLMRECGIFPESFYDRRNQTIWESMLEMLVCGESVDVVTLAKKLDSKKSLEMAGGIQRLRELNADFNKENFNDYCEIVREDHQFRVEIELFSKAVEMAYNGESGVSLVMDHLSASKSLVGDARGLHGCAEDFIEDCKRGKYGNFNWWCEEWTDKLGRMTNDIVILHAPRSTGKTALMLQWIVRAEEGGDTTPLASIEMLKDDLSPRLIAHLGQVGTFAMRARGFVTPDEEDRARSTLAQLERLDRLVRDKSMTMRDISTWGAGEWFRWDQNGRKGGFAIFIDNLLSISMGGERFESKTIFYDHCLRKIRDIRNLTESPVILLAHPNSEGKVAWSSDVENFADIIIYLTQVPPDGLDIKSLGRKIMPRSDVQGKHILASFQKNRNGVYPIYASLDFICNTQTFRHLCWEE